MIIQLELNLKPLILESHSLKPSLSSKHDRLPVTSTFIYFSYILQDGRLEAGDQILSVNENGLVDVTQTQ